MAPISKKVVLILFPGAIAYELLTAAQVLSRVYAVEVATPTGADHVDESGLTYRARCYFAEVEAAACAAVLIAGGGLLSIKDHEALNSLLRQAYEQGVLLGAICAGPLALAQAGVLVGHTYTQAGRYPASDEYRWEGAELRKEPVVVSGTIVTALPEAHVEFAITLGKQLGIFESEEEAQRQRGFYRGEYERDWSKVGPVEGL